MKGCSGGWPLAPGRQLPFPRGLHDGVVRQRRLRAAAYGRTEGHMTGRTVGHMYSAGVRLRRGGSGAAGIGILLATQPSSSFPPPASPAWRHNVHANSTTKQAVRHSAHPHQEVGTCVSSLALVPLGISLVTVSWGTPSRPSVRFSATPCQMDTGARAPLAPPAGRREAVHEARVLCVLWVSRGGRVPPKPRAVLCVLRIAEGGGEGHGACPRVLHSGGRGGVRPWQVAHRTCDCGRSIAQHLSAYAEERSGGARVGPRRERDAHGSARVRTTTEGQADLPARPERHLGAAHKPLGSWRKLAGSWRGPHLEAGGAGGALCARRAVARQLKRLAGGRDSEHKRRSDDLRPGEGPADKRGGMHRGADASRQGLYARSRAGAGERGGGVLMQPRMASCHLCVWRLQQHASG